MQIKYPISVKFSFKDDQGILYSKTCEIVPEHSAEFQFKILKNLLKIAADSQNLIGTEYEYLLKKESNENSHNS